MAVPFTAALQHFNIETRGRFADYEHVLWAGCNYADQCYFQRYGIGVWTSNQKMNIWKGYFKDYLIRSGVPSSCVTKLSAACGKMHKLYCTR